MRTPLKFFFLQVADFATTMVALRMGGVEKNFLVARLMGIGSVQGLILSKVVTLAIAAGILLARKDRVIRWANVVFGGVVLWNLLVIAALAFQANGVKAEMTPEQFAKKTWSGLYGVAGVNRKRIVRFGAGEWRVAARDHELR